MLYCYSYRQQAFLPSAEQETEAAGMLARVNTPNHVQERVERDPAMGAQVRWTPMDATAVPTFPRLDEAYIRKLTFGVYQLKQANNYADEHLQNGAYEVS